jgi:hypothetical protein
MRVKARKLARNKGARRFKSASLLRGNAGSEGPLRLRGYVHTKSDEVTEGSGLSLKTGRARAELQALSHAEDAVARGVNRRVEARRQRDTQGVAGIDGVEDAVVP